MGRDGWVISLDLFFGIKTLILYGLRPLIVFVVAEGLGGAVFVCKISLCYSFEFAMQNHNKIKDLLPYIIDSVEKSKARYEVHSFDSGAIMVDIWVKNNFYVIQIYGDKIGLSLVNEETPLFDTRPDRLFKDVGEFKSEFEKILL